jgi:DNA-binding GntR family transcriptional regulator/predicted GNAT family acetyltransferase
MGGHMIKECKEQDRSALISYLNQEPVYNTFMLADIEDFGFEEKFQTVYMDVEQGECIGVYLCFYQNLLVYSKDENINISFLEQLISWFIPDVVMGKTQDVKIVQRILCDYELTQRPLYLCDSADNLVEEKAEIKRAVREDADEIFSFLQSIPELKSLYTSKQMIEDRIIKNTGVHYLIRENGKIIAQGNSAARCEKTVMIGGVAVNPEYRNQKLASQIVSRLCREIFDQGKTPCLFSSMEKEHNLYCGLGFHMVGEWATLAEFTGESLTPVSQSEQEVQEEENKFTAPVKRSRLPSYIPVYNQLYNDIVSGIYEKSSLLPAETVLAEKYHVSRNTLRQALTILTQDGYIYKRQGKGTYVSFDKDKKLKEKIYNYLTEDVLEEIVRISMDHNFGLPTQIAREKLELSMEEEVLASNNVYFGEGGPVGQSFLQIPAHILKQCKVKMNSNKELLEFMNKGIYKEVAGAEVHIQIMEADEQVISYLDIASGTPLLHIEQMLYDRENRAIARIKYYFCQGRYQIQYRL